MTQAPTDAPTVTPEDREAYLSLNMLPPEDADAVRAGRWDGVTGMQVLARHRIAHTTPEPVLRWEGDELMLGEEEIGCAFETPIGYCWQADLGTDRHGAEPTLPEARAAAEQSVRDWLARAGLGGAAGEPVAWKNYAKDGDWWLTDDQEHPDYCERSVPLYAHPPASPTAEVVEALKALLDSCGARGVYHSLRYSEAVERAEAVLAKVQP